MKRILSLVIVLLALAGLRCSVVDGQSREELHNQIVALPPDSLRGLKKWVADQKITAYLKKHGGNFKIGDVRCRTFDGDTLVSEPSGDSIEEILFGKSIGDLTIGDVLYCIMALPTFSSPSPDASIYEHCVYEAAKRKMDAANEQLKSSGSNLWLDCMPTLNPGWDEDTLVAEAQDSDTASPGEYNRMIENVTVRDVADTLIASDIPPPLPGLFGAGAAGFRILPILCGMSSGDHWGCPDSPGYPAKNGGDQ